MRVSLLSGLLCVAFVAAAVPGLALLPAGSVELKGMTEREPIYILVGDEDVARSPMFAALGEAHRRLVADLASGADHALSLDACRRAALDVDSRLGAFYSASVERIEDFLSRPAALALA